MKNYLKGIVAVTMLFSVTMSVSAQFDNNRIPDRFHLCVHGGMSSSTFTGYTEGSFDVNPLVFVTGGVSIDKQIAPVPVFIGTGLNYLKQRFYSEERENIWGSSNKKRGMIESDAIHIPLNVGYHLNVSPNLFISPYLGGFASICLYKWQDEWYQSDEMGDRINFGLRIGCGLNFGRLTLDVAYDFGKCDYYDDHNEYHNYKVYQNTFFATVGYNIVGSR